MKRVTRTLVTLALLLPFVTTALAQDVPPPSGPDQKPEKHRKEAPRHKKDKRDKRRHDEPRPPQGPEDGPKKSSGFFLTGGLYLGLGASELVQTNFVADKPSAASTVTPNPTTFSYALMFAFGRTFIEKRIGAGLKIFYGGDLAFGEPTPAGEPFRGLSQMTQTVQLIPFFRTYIYTSENKKLLAWFDTGIPLIFSRSTSPHEWTGPKRIQSNGMTLGTGIALTPTIAYRFSPHLVVYTTLNFMRFGYTYLHTWATPLPSETIPPDRTETQLRKHSLDLGFLNMPEKGLSVGITYTF